MWVSYISPQNLIGPLTTEIYYRTGIIGQTDRQSDRQTDRQTARQIDTETESDNLPIQDKGWSKNDGINRIEILYSFIYGVDCKFF